LIQNGADFLTFMNWGLETAPKQLQLFPELDQNELTVYQFLTEMKEAHIDSIAVKCCMSTSQLNVLLFQLEMKNIIQAISGNRFKLTWKDCA
jgi:DNA processing protein